MSEYSNPGNELSEDAAIVRDYLEASMKPVPQLSATFVCGDVTITFTGDRQFNHPSGPASFNAMRYKWVKKRMDRFDVSESKDCTVVYSVGTLFGEWPDGTAFEANRYIDRFEVQDGKITKMDVWNDSAERILERMGVKA